MENSNTEHIVRLEQQLIHVSKSREYTANSISMLVADIHQKEVTLQAIEQELMEIEQKLQEIWDENQRIKQRLISHTVSLMHQRRKAANHVDDQYFEKEVYIQAHEEIAKAIKAQKELLLKQQQTLQQWSNQTSGN